MFRRRDEEFDTQDGSSTQQSSLLGGGNATSNSGSPSMTSESSSGSASASSSGSGSSSYSAPQASSGSNVSATGGSAPSSSTYTPSAPGTYSAASRGNDAASRPAAPNAGANPYRPGAQGAAPRMPEAKPVTPFSATGVMSAAATGGQRDNRRVLTVGADILLKGEIATCDRLVIEGKVDATLNDVHTVEIAESGSFKGTAQVEMAEISGVFEGDLVVKGRLVIYSAGKVRGKVAYGEIEIERGGELSGEIKSSASVGSAAPRMRSKDAAAA